MAGTHLCPEVIKLANGAQDQPEPVTAQPWEIVVSTQPWREGETLAAFIASLSWTAEGCSGSTKEGETTGDTSKASEAINEGEASKKGRVPVLLSQDGVGHTWEIFSSTQINSADDLRAMLSVQAIDVSSIPPF